MKNFIGILLLMLIVAPLYPQEIIKLEDCYKLAADNYPIKPQIENYEKLSKLNIENIATAYMPEISLVAKVQYQSDVTKVNIDIPIPNMPAIEVPEPPKEQLSAGISVNQLLWDGGISSGRKDLEKVSNEINRQNIEIEINSLKFRINDLFFNVILIDKNIELFNNMIGDLNSKLQKLGPAVENGVMLESNLEVLKAEIIKVQQSINELESARKTSIDILSEITGKKISHDAEFKLPEINTEKLPEASKERPEYKLFDLTKKQVNSSERIIDAKTLPKISFYGQAMYGRPGLNMFDDEFKPYYIAGLQASWKFFNWGESSRDKEINEIRKDIIETQEDNFERSIRISTRQFLNDIELNKELAKQDGQIIELRRKVADNASEQLDNGVITATDYLTEKNSELRAEILMQKREIEIIKAKVKYLTQIGMELN